MTPQPYYLILGSEPFCNGSYSIASVRSSDTESIRLWRNEQISALRQASEISPTEQENYFRTCVFQEFPETHPSQILVRFCNHSTLIGYGGIVHLDWDNLHGEVSFLLETSRTKDHGNYSKELDIFFQLIKEVAFSKIGLNKLTTEAYSHRKFHVDAIENAGFNREGVLREQIRMNGNWVDAVIASCLSSEYTPGRDG